MEGSRAECQACGTVWPVELPEDKLEGEPDFGPKVKAVLRAVTREYKNNPNGRQKWSVAPAARIIKIWKDYATLGFVRDESGLQRIADQIVENARKVTANTILIESDMNQEINTDFFNDDEGIPRAGDAAESLGDMADRLEAAKTAEQQLQIIDRILSMIHHRSDLAGWFIEGGRETLDKLKNQKTGSLLKKATYYHVTKEDRVNSILRDGLKTNAPATDDLYEEVPELDEHRKNKIFLWPDLEDAEFHQTGDDEILAVELDSSVMKDPQMQGGLYVEHDIPATAISKVSNLLKKADVPDDVQHVKEPTSKEFDAVRYVYQQYYDNQIQKLSWKDFQKRFQQFAQKYPKVWMEVRENRPQITILDLDRWLEEKKVQESNYEIEHDEYHDADTSFRDAKQLVMRINQSASTAEILGEDPVFDSYVKMVAQGGQQSGHPVNLNTVGWLRLDFINDDWLLVDEIQSDLVNSITQAKAMVSQPNFQAFVDSYDNEKIKRIILEKVNEASFDGIQRHFRQKGWTVEKLDEIKGQLVRLFQDWAEYGLASLIELCRRHGIKNIAVHTAETIGQRDESVDAEKVGMYYDQLAKSFGFKKQPLDIGDLKGNFWVRTASRYVTATRPPSKTTIKLYPVDDMWIMRAKEFLRDKWSERHIELGREGLPEDLAGACKFASLFAKKLFGGQIVGNADHQVLKTVPRIIDLTDKFDAETFRNDRQFLNNPEHRESMASCEPRVAQWAEEFRQRYRNTSHTAGEIYTFFGLNFNVDMAARMVASTPRQTTEPSKEWLESTMGMVNIDEKHLPNVDTAKPGIIAQLTFKDGYRFTPLIDGNHRATKCLQEGKQFTAHVLTPEESWKVMTSVTPPLLWARGKMINPSKGKKGAKPRRRERVVEPEEPYRDRTVDTSGMGWLDRDGNFHDNGSKIHSEAAKALGLGRGADYTAIVNDAISRGNVRVQADRRYVDFEVSKLDGTSRKNIAEYLMMNSSRYSAVQIEMKQPTSQENFGSVEEAIEWLEGTSRYASKKASLSSETLKSGGAWLAPDGQEFPLLEGEEHGRAALRLGIIDTSKLKGSGEHQALVNAALHEGYVRVVFRPGGNLLQFECMKLNSHVRRMISDVIIENASKKYLVESHVPIKDYWFTSVDEAVEFLEGSSVFASKKLKVDKKLEDLKTQTSIYGPDHEKELLDQYAKPKNSFNASLLHEPEGE